MAEALVAVTLVASPPLSVAAFATLPASATAPTQTPAQDALAALSGQPNGPLPAGTHLRSINLAGGLATVDFSREFESNFSGGDTQGIRTICAALRTLGQFATVQRVQFLVDGHPIDTLGGMLSLSDPLAVIRPNAARPRSTVWLHRKASAEVDARA